MIYIDLISGFLGAGKTTFCNMLLRHYIDKGHKPVYIVNEFGQTGLDAQIIKSDGFETMEMHGGCICCTLKGEIASSVSKIIEAFAPTHIVFEPSGIFIFDDFFDVLKDPLIKGKCTPGNIITIVDGVNFKYTKAMYGSFLFNQIKNAPTLIISKLEKKKYTPDEIIADIKNINPDASILAKPWENLNAEDMEILLTQKKGIFLNHPAHIHGAFRSVTIRPEENFTSLRLSELTNLCITGVFGELFRIKGVIEVEDSPTLINIANDDVNIEEFKGYSESTLTFIGTAINREEINKFFRL